jgi:hypothetical protein
MYGWCFNNAWPRDCVLQVGHGISERREHDLGRYYYGMWGPRSYSSKSNTYRAVSPLSWNKVFKALTNLTARRTMDVTPAPIDAFKIAAFRRGSDVLRSCSSTPRILFPFWVAVPYCCNFVWPMASWHINHTVIENTGIYNTRQSVGCIVRKLRDFFPKDWVYTIATVQANENLDNDKPCDGVKNVLSPRPVSKIRNILGKTPAVWRALLHGKNIFNWIEFFSGISRREIHDALHSKETGRAMLLPMSHMLMCSRIFRDTFFTLLVCFYDYPLFFDEIS